MAIKITSREYLKGMSWTLKSRARIDSVSVTPYTRTSQSDVIHTQEITAGLPIADNYAGSKTFREMSNRYFNGFSWFDLARGYTELAVLKGSYIAHLAEPPANTPVAF